MSKTRDTWDGNCENCKAVPVEIEGFICETCMADHNVRAARRVRTAKPIEGDG